MMSLPMELEDYSGTNNEERNVLKYQSGQERAQASTCPEDPAQLRGLENKQQDKLTYLAPPLSAPIDRPSRLRHATSSIL